MAIDLQVVFPEELVPLNGVRILAGISPRSIDVTGSDFRSVDQVLINNVPSPDVIIVSKTRLFAQVPDSLVQATLTSVSVTATKLMLTNKSYIRFRLNPMASKVSGILRLVQVFLKILLTTPGIDIFAPRIGGGALRNLGLTFGKDESGGIVSDFILAVASTQRQIQALQARDTKIPSDERLLSARVTTSGYSYEESALLVTVELTSHAGRAATANLQM